MSYSVQDARTLAHHNVMMQYEKSQESVDHGEILSIPCLMGPVGIGKTSIARALAAELRLPLLTINCGESSDSTDVAGCLDPWAMPPEPTKRFMRFALEERLFRACHEKVFLFFDDIDKAPGLTLGALIGLFGTRRVRTYELHPDTILFAAGNRVGDDQLSNQLSESLRTRMTIIPMQATLKDFAAYAEDNPGKVHSAVLGFLHYKPEYLHKHSEDQIRFPNPRGWVEASYDMKKFGPKDRLVKTATAWETIVAMKCGEPVASDFRAWHEIVSKIDVDKLLKTGVLDHTLGADDLSMLQYAAIYAVVQELDRSGVKPAHQGLQPFVEGLSAELCVAMVTQLTKKVRDGIKTHHKDVGDLLMRPLVQQNPGQLGGTL